MEIASVVGAVTYDPITASLSLTLPATLDQVSLFVDGISPNGGSNSATVSTPRGTSPICITPTQF